MRTNISLLCAAMAAIALASCEKGYVADEEDPAGAAENGALVVRTAAAAGQSDDGAGHVSYPVSVYVIDSEGKGVALQQIESAADELKLTLAAGTYDVYAVGGAAGYDLPDIASFSESAQLKPKEGRGHGDLMTAYNSVVMARGEENRLTLELQRRVIQVQSVTLNDIPEDVSAVRLTISPLRAGILLDGSYAEGTASHTFSLVRQDDGTTWKSAESEYLLEASNTVTLKVSLTSGGQTTSYSYASGERLSANHKVSITGNFIDDRHIKLSGTIKGTDWEEPINMTFDFDSADKTPTEGEEDTGGQDEPLHGGAPQAGTLYKGCYVLRSVNAGNATTVTLLTPNEANKIKHSDSKDAAKKQQSIKEATAEALSEIEVKGVPGWRLPDKAEMDYIYKNIDSINAKIEALGSESITAVALKGGGYACGYFFTADDGNVYVYELVDGDNINKSPNSGRATYKVRGVATLTFAD